MYSGLTGEMATRKTALVLPMNKRKFRGQKAEHDEGTIKIRYL